MRVFDLSVTDAPGALHDVRHALSRMLGEAVDDQLLDSALLVVSELVTNANRHGGDGRCQLRVALEHGRCRIEVIDSSPFRPVDVPAPVDAESECGRGLLVVSALARRWGSGAHRLGKCVWAELPVATRRP